MFFWFVGLSILGVWVVFQSPSVDYRLVAVGAVLPVSEVVLGGPFVLHTLLIPVLSLGLVMLATQGKRLLRRRLIGIPIGLMIHLVLDGAFADRTLFWWPFFGFGFPDETLGEFGRPWQLTAAMEFAGLAAIGWMWTRFDFGEPENRSRFVSSGQLPRRATGADLP